MSKPPRDIDFPPGTKEPAIEDQVEGLAEDERQAMIRLLQNGVLRGYQVRQREPLVDFTMIYHKTTFLLHDENFDEWSIDSYWEQDVERLLMPKPKGKWTKLLDSVKSWWSKPCSTG